jgi:hypothetical protein
MRIDVGKANVELLASDVAYFSKPMSVSKGFDQNQEQEGIGSTFRITTTDDLDIVIMVVTWPNASPEVIFLEWLDGLNKYQRLKSAGRLGVLLNPGPEWVAELRVLKYSQKESRPTLARSSFEDLSSMLGSDSVAFLLETGALQVGTRASIIEDAGPRRNELAMKFRQGDANILAAAYALTRVLPLMHDFGLPEGDL